MEKILQLRLARRRSGGSILIGCNENFPKCAVGQQDFQNSSNARRLNSQTSIENAKQLSHKTKQCSKDRADARINSCVDERVGAIVEISVRWTVMNHFS